MLRSGYATAATAKLFEAVHKAKSEGKRIDEDLYGKAVDFYEEAFSRCVFIEAENSVGFHNHPDAMPVLGVSIAFALKSEALLRQIPAEAGVGPPAKVPLEMTKYLDDRGGKKLKGEPSIEIKDPMNLQDMF